MGLPITQRMGRRFLSDVSFAFKQVLSSSDNFIGKLNPEMLPVAESDCWCGIDIFSLTSSHKRKKNTSFQ